MGTPKAKRRGGVFDDSVVYVNYTRKKLVSLFKSIEIKLREQNERATKANKFSK